MSIEALLSRYLEGAVITGLVRLHGGMETDVFRFDADGRPLVLRLYTFGDFGGRAFNEAQVICRLKVLGYPVPGLIAFEPDSTLLGGPFLIMEWIDGEVLWRHYQDRVQEMGSALVSLMLQLHSIDGEYVAEGLSTTFSLAALDQMLAAADMAEPFKPLLARLRQWGAAVPSWSPVLIHGDYHSENVMITREGKPQVIDWGSTSLADPRVDVANTMAILLTNGQPERAKEFRAHYERLCGRPLPDMDYFESLCIARRLIVFLVTMVKGPTIFGLKPGIEIELRRQAPGWSPLVRLLEEQADVELPAIHALLA